MSARFFCWDAGELAVVGRKMPPNKRENKESFGQAFTKACGASSSKRHKWWMKRDDDGVAVKIHRRSKP